MARENLNDLVAFVTIAREMNFTRAAARLGISQSALSHSLRNLEERLDVRLITRTTRSVSLTELGKRFLEDLGPYIDGIHDKIQVLKDLSNKPSGTIRISTSDFAIYQFIWPKIKGLIDDYPDITVELIDDYSLIDIVAQRFDAGVRLGEQLTNGMISVRISPDLRCAVVAAPRYFERYQRPQMPEDLREHSCINLRLPTHGSLYEWEFSQGERKLNLKVDGQLVFGRVDQVLMACREGYGLAQVPYDMVSEDIKAGRLISVLEDWCPCWEGFYLYYPSRRQPSKAFELLLERLRYYNDKEVLELVKA